MAGGSQSGAGGSGKSRFAIELCRRMADEGWGAGFWTLGAPGPLIALPRLVIVDYGEAVPARTLVALLESLRGGASEAAPVRVVLLTRGGEFEPLELVAENAAAPLRLIFDGREVLDAVTGELSGAQRMELYRRAREAFQLVWNGSGVVEEETPELPGVPLDVLFEALDRTLAGVGSGDPRPPIDRALAHERRY